MEIKEPSHTVGETANWYSHYGKQYGVSSKKLRIGLPYPYLKRYLHIDVHNSIIHSGQDLEATEVSYDR